MLKLLFTEFDKMCVKHDVYKVYTIGDCYVVMGFTNANKRVIFIYNYILKIFIKLNRIY